MTAFNLYPTFTDRDGYVGWRKAWKATYAGLSLQIKTAKATAKEHQRVTLLQGADGFHKATRAQAELRHHRAVGRKMMSLLQEAKERRDRIIEMQKSITDQDFPLTISANRVDFSYNRGHNEFAFLPRWIVKMKGKTYYIDHIDSKVGFNTRELDGGSTRGMLRFNHCVVHISADRTATITPA